MQARISIYNISFGKKEQAIPCSLLSQNQELNPASRLLDHVVDRDAQLTHYRIAGCGDAETVDADHYSVKPSVFRQMSLTPASTAIRLRKPLGSTDSLYSAS